MKNLKMYVGVFVVAIMGSLFGTGVYQNYFQKPSSLLGRPLGNVAVHNVNFTGQGGMNMDFTGAAEQTVPTVVHVMTKYNRSVNQGNYFDPFGFFWGAPQQQQKAPQEQATGSGVIISEDGYIVTNNHVVDDASEVQVTLDDKRTYTAKIIGTDPSTDLALLKVDAKGLPYLSYGNSDNVKVGEWVLAVGNPFNLTSTVTAGIVSAKARNIHILPDKKFPIESFIQTDAAVNPGNSGGALVNTNGELVGINAAIASNTGSYSGYSFAIPVNIVKKVVDDLLQYGNVQRGFIGVSIRDIDADFAKQKDIKTLDGVYVNGITDGGAAAQAGIKEGDIIVNINGTPIKTTPELQEQVGLYRPGDKINVTVLREEKEKSLVVTLRNKEGNTSVVKNDVANVLGAQLEPLNEQEQEKIGLSGVRVKNIETGKLKSAGIQQGFIITSIDNKPVKKSEDVINYLENKKGGVLIEGVYPNGMKAYYGFGM